MGGPCQYSRWNTSTDLGEIGPLGARDLYDIMLGLNLALPLTLYIV